jgi:hypothetical protein
MKTYRDLQIWQKSMTLVTEITIRVDDFVPLPLCAYMNCYPAIYPAKNPLSDNPWEVNG